MDQALREVLYPVFRRHGWSHGELGKHLDKLQQIHLQRPDRFIGGDTQLRFIDPSGPYFCKIPLDPAEIESLVPLVPSAS